MSEKQAISLAKRNKLEVTQTETARYKKTGVIPTGDPLKAFIKTLEQLFETVTLATDEKGKVLSGKKRQYVCTNRLKGVAKRDDKRLAQFSDVEQEFKQEVLKILMYKQLQNDNSSYTIKHWAKQVLGAVYKANASSFRVNLDLSLSQYEHDDNFYNLFNSDYIISDFKTRFDDSVKNLTEKTFKALESEGSIKLNNSYRAITLDSKGNQITAQIDEATHSFITATRKKFINENFGSHFKFANICKSEKSEHKRSVEMFQNFLINATGYFYSFNNLEIEVIKPFVVDKLTAKSAKLNVKKLVKANFQSKIMANRTRDNIAKKWNGQGYDPLGFAPNAFATELVQLYLGCARSNSALSIELNGDDIADYVQRHNKNRGTNYILKLK